MAATLNNIISRSCIKSGKLENVQIKSIFAQIEPPGPDPMGKEKFEHNLTIRQFRLGKK